MQVITYVVFELEILLGRKIIRNAIHERWCNLYVKKNGAKMDENHLPKTFFLKDFETLP